MPRWLRLTAAASTLLVLAACRTAEMPDVVVGGPAADVLRFHDWEQVVIGGKVVKWQGVMTRRSDDPIGYMTYRLLDPEGRTLSSSTLDYRNSFLYDGQPFEPGDSLPISIAAYRGDAYGNQVARIQIDILAP